MSRFVTGNNLLHTSNYKDRFDTEFYLIAAYSDVNIDLNEAPFSAFFIENTVRIFKNKQKRLDSAKALEFGGGPSIWPSFLLAQHVDSIQFCDYAPCNLNAVKDWIEQKNNAFDWTKFFEKILDANGTPREKLPQWESRLRDALTRGGLSTCDVNDSNCPILNGKENDYDIILSSLCLEAACLTIEIFNETIKRLVRLLKSGGLLLLLMVRNESFYYVNQEKFFCLPLDETKVKQALDQTNGIVDVYIDSSDTMIDDQQRNTESDFDGKMVIHAYKKIE
jgi:nicotinamide N-methyltransferase/phenylethanolamine N-methyltransferase/methyltransferase